MLQVVTVFTDVKKGVVANDKELQTGFKSTDHHKICLEILQQGELQVSEKERKEQLDNLFRDIATLVVEKTVNKQTGKPFTVGVIEAALHEAHYNPNNTKTAKQQVGAAIKLLKESSKLPVERAKMRLLITLHSDAAYGEMKNSEAGTDWVLEKETVADKNILLQVAIDPSHFRLISDLAKKDSGTVEVLSGNTSEDADTAASSSSSSAPK